MIVVSIIIGGMIGGAMRFVLETVIPTPLSLPLGTLLINLSGAFCLGLFYALADKKGYKPYIRAGIGTGIIGSYTTFSTMSLEMTELAKRAFALAALYGVISVVCGVLLVAAGERVVEAIFKHPLDEEKVPV